MIRMVAAVRMMIMMIVVMVMMAMVGLATCEEDTAGEFKGRRQGASYKRSPGANIGCPAIP